MEESMALLKVTYTTRYGKFIINDAIDVAIRRTFDIAGPVSSLAVELVHTDRNKMISTVQVGVTIVEVHAHEWEAAAWLLAGLEHFRLSVESEIK